MAHGLLEREHEIGVLGAALDEATRGTGTLVVVEGEPGIGKTALLRHGARRRRAAAAPRCSPRGAASSSAS